ncbi:MAG: hypothetical protein ACOYLI_12380 [Synechococcus lacustris]
MTPEHSSGVSTKDTHHPERSSTPRLLPLLQHLPEQWQQIAQQFRHCNAPRWNDEECLNSS